MKKQLNNMKIETNFAFGLGLSLNYQIFRNDDKIEMVCTCITIGVITMYLRFIKK